jgi:thiol-disulfide isomerase/thioredoxin
MKRIAIVPLLALGLLVLGLAGARPVDAQTTMDPTLWFDVDSEGEATVNLYFFWSETCPHCRSAHPIVEDFPSQYPWLTLHSHEISMSEDNALLYEQMAAAAGEQAMYVPAFIFCGAMITGWDAAETTGAALQEGLEQCHNWVLDNPVVLSAVGGPPLRSAAAASTQDTGVEPDSAEPEPVDGTASKGEPGDGTLSTAEGDPGSAAAAADGEVQPTSLGLPMTIDATFDAAPALALPFIGEVEAQALSLPALTFVIAGLDAFNPCAFFVLMFLLSLMVYARDRKRMLLIGVTFVFFSGLIYFVFMSAWLNLFLFIGELRIITMIAGLIAVAIALINIKDFFWFKQGVSLSIPDRAKPGLYQRSRNLLKATSLGAILAGTAVLAIAANSYELLCTSGFPMVYTRMLTLHELPTATFYSFLALYNVIYIIPLLVIVVLFTVRFGSHKLTEQEGRSLKLVSGLMMLALGGLLVFAPNALNQLWTAALLLLGTLVVAGVIIIIDRRLHPELYGSSQPV